MKKAVSFLMALAMIATMTVGCARKKAQTQPVQSLQPVSAPSVPAAQQPSYQRSAYDYVKK